MGKIDQLLLVSLVCLLLIPVYYIPVASYAYFSQGAINGSILATLVSIVMIWGSILILMITYLYMSTKVVKLLTKTIKYKTSRKIIGK